MNFPKSFIKATEKYNTFEESVPAPYLRKSFFSDVSTTAKVVIAVCGFYEFYLNGKEYTKGFFAPYISNTDHYIYCDEYTVPIDRGENVIGVLLGNGLQNNPGGHIWEFDKATFRSAPMIALSIAFTDSKGKEIIIESDASFKTFDSPIRTDDYRFGEYYDANLEMHGWNDKGFDDSLWKSAINATPPRGELRLCDAEPIVPDEKISPVKIIKDGDSYIYDFGVINSGLCELVIDGIKGQKIELQYGELLKEDKLCIENIWFVREYWERDKHIVHKDTYICKGERGEKYIPTFTYHGFRYVKVSGITPEQATKELLTYITLHSNLTKRGGFTCSSEIINKLQEITNRSDISNFYYFPTDCPQREKNGWTADAALSCEHMLMNFTPEVSYREWLRNICKAQNKKGALPGIVPTGGWGFEWGNGPAWDCVLVYLPYYVYMYRGETEMIKESASSFISYLHYLTTRKDSDGLIHIGLGDWCHVGGITPKAPLRLTDSVMSMDIARKMAFLFDVIGMNAQRDFANTVATELKEAIRNKLINYETMIADGCCQTSQAMCIYYNIFTQEESSIAFERLLSMIHDADDHMDVGVLGGRIIFHVLSHFGQSELAFKMITRSDFPSYGNLLQRGATTLWESFLIDEVESMNHHFWGDISSWFIKYLSGIQFNPQANDITILNIKPSFVSMLDYAEGYYNAPHGKIISSWKRTAMGIILSLQIPEKIKATAMLENGFVFEDGSDVKSVSSGEYIIKIQHEE